MCNVFLQSLHDELKSCCVINSGSLHDELKSNEVMLCNVILKSCHDVFFQSLHDIDYVVQDRMFIEGVLNVEFRDSTDKGMFITGT